ncbi:MAG: hypothetical protein ACD_45C00268G0001 [uncultured bacterium]|nr:MAG: hypothetical protein ACD_45C00268G0001 [uncultured bacterium]
MMRGERRMLSGGLWTIFKTRVTTVRLPRLSLSSKMKDTTFKMQRVGGNRFFMGAHYPTASCLPSRTRYCCMSNMICVISSLNEDCLTVRWSSIIILGWTRVRMRKYHYKRDLLCISVVIAKIKK